MCIRDSLSSGLRPGLGLRQNLAFGQTRARIAQAQAEAEGVRQQARGAEALVRFEVEEAYRNVVVAEAARDASERTLEIARRWLTEEQINADLGLSSARDLVRAARARLAAELDALTAVQRYNVAVLRLVARTGRLLTWDWTE